ncbi:unnamed protein product [Moneuplotes crassus]|uniref:Uncharacterized protein n=2 Tax=Euplotes crassus TaxID=5936 RepID=A0AAD1UM13_EUPCR|nr:unnamed protein product [Moneuplotes crassus]
MEVMEEIMGKRGEDETKELVFELFVLSFTIITLVMVLYGLVVVKRVFLSCRRTKDVFKIAQYVMMIGYMITGQVYATLEFFRFFGFFFKTAASFINFFIVTFEWMNSLCWLVLILHILRLRRKREDGNYSLKLMKLTEILLLINFVIAALIFLGCIIAVNILSIVKGCYRCFPETKESCSFCSDIILKTWINDLDRYFTVCMFLQPIIRLILGSLLLFLMRKYINYYYKKRKWKIFFAMIGTVVFFQARFITYYILYTVHEKLSFEEIFICRDQDCYIKERHWYIFLSFFICILFVIFEVSLFKINVENVTFKEDIRELIKSCGIKQHYSNSSIFILSSKTTSSKAFFSDSKSRLLERTSSLLSTTEKLWIAQSEDQLDLLCRDSNESDHESWKRQFLNSRV